MMGFLFVSNVALANKELVIAVGLAKPPYIIQENDKGFELELIRNVLKKMDKTVKFVYTKLSHSSKMLELQNVDAVITTNKSVFNDHEKLSHEYITYQNVAISLKENNFRISNISDLADYSISSFQKADKVLGKEFASIVKKTPLFIKVADQSRQPSQLLKKRVDVLIIDINVFKHFVNKLGINEIESRFTVHQIFPVNNYRVAFKNPKYVKYFNDNLTEYIHTKEYQSLKGLYNL
jgi:polar amino acid transport system substrate-binding protein